MSTDSIVKIVSGGRVLYASWEKWDGYPSRKGAELLYDLSKFVPTGSALTEQKPELIGPAKNEPSDGGADCIYTIDYDTEEFEVMANHEPYRFGRRKIVELIADVPAAVNWMEEAIHEPDDAGKE